MSKYDARGYYSRWKNSKLEEEEDSAVKRSSSDSSGKYDARGYLTRHKLGLDTLESDLHTMGETLNNIYGSWQTKETMDNTFESVNNMYTRLGKYQDYYTQYGKESGLPDLSELLNNYKKAVEGWGDQTKLYGNYQNADAFNKAVKDYQLSEKFKGLSYGDVQARMRRYSPDSDEYNYLKNYTGYTSAEDFDKAIAGLSTDIGMFDKANEYEGRISSYEGQADKFKKRTNGLTNDGGYGKKADDTRVEYNAWLAENGFDSGNALKAEYADEVKLAKELGKAKNIYELDNSTADKYKYLEQNEDFAEHSQYDSSVNEGKKPHYQPFTNYDIKYDYINNVPEIRDSYERKAGNKDAGTAFSDNGWEYLTEKELAYYNYLHYLDGQNGTKKSDKFLEDLKPALQKRYSEKASERREEMLENPFAATAFSLASPVMTIAGGIGNLMATGKDIVTGSEYNPYDPLREISNANAHGREVVSQNIAEATEGFELFGQNIASFLYNTGESVLDTVVGGSAFGRGYTALMGTNAYQQKAKELTEQGYDATTVQGLAITSGVLEMAFEYAGFDHLMKLKDADSIGKVIYNALVSQGGAEGLEELGTSIGNMMAEYGFLGEDSQYMKKYNDLIARGFSEKEASTEVAKAMASEIAWSYAGGWLSGVGLGTGTSVGQYTQNKAVGKSLRGAEQIGDVLNIASMTPEESEAYEAYTRYANKGVTVDNITDAQLGNLYNTMSSEVKGGFRTAVTDLANAHGEMTTQRTTLGYEYESAKNDMLSAKAEIDTLKGIIDSKESTEVQKASASADLDNAIAKYNEAQQRMNRAYEPAVASESLTDRQRNKAQNKLDKAVSEYTDAQTRFGKYAPIADKLSGVEESVGAYNAKRTIEKAEAEKRAKHEAEVKKLSSGVETSVMADTDKAIEIKGMKDSDTLITSDGEVKLKDVELSDRDADLVAYARGMEASEASLYLEQYKGEENIEEYTNTFSLVTSMAKNNYSEDAILKAKGSLSTEQFNAIYAATVTERYREKQRNIDKLNAEMAGKMSYKGVIDDSVINYSNKTVKGKVKWSELNSRQREAVTFISGFAKATGMNLKFITDGERRGINGSYDKATNTITIDVYAGMSKSKNLLKDTIIPTMSHETTHWMKEKSPELYRKIGGLVFKTLEARDKISEVDRIASEVARQKAKGKNITDDGARDEIIARACEDMLKMSEEGKRLFNSLSESEKKTFIDKVKEILANLMEWVDNLLNSYEYSKRYEARIMREYKDTLAEMSKMWDTMLADAVKANQSMEKAGIWGNEVTSIGGRDLSEFADAINTDGEKLFQYRAMEEDEDTYRNMLLKYKDIIGINVDDIEALFNMVDKALGIIKNNLEALDYGWDTDINDRAFMPVKPNSDSLYQVSLDFSTLCRKRLLQQTIQNTLQEALQKQLSTEEAIAIRDELMKIQEEGKKIEIACALCYVESARMKSPKQINKFLNNRDAIIREFFANRSGGSIKQMVADAEMRARQELARQHPNGYKGKNDIEVDVLTAPKKQLKTKDAQFVRDEGKKAKASYELTAKEQAELDAALELNVSDFTSADGLESLAKDHSDIFDAYVSFVRNATHSKGIEKDTWWRAGDSDLIGDTLIANMNKENGLRSQSWSDFQVIHLLDYIAATIELSTKGAKRQSYTKVPDYVKLLGNTGDMINMSLIPERVFNGKLSYDGVEGMAYEIAKQLRDEYHATAGTICIGITNDQIKMLLADKTIDMVIPYHKSSMSQATRKLMHIPTWDDYEDYQQEKKLDDNEAKAQAKRYGVELKMDGNYQKAPKFSEWFNLEEARQIAKMENENPSNTDEQQKYGIMYGGYKAMQNAANKYLKLCAERGLSPKFSHQNADFTGEENYWKLLIDRKMVDNVTGEIIEQKAIKPIFSEKSVLEILNDELERYPQIKKDNDYAASKVVKKFLSGEMKVDKSTLEALKKPVDNVAVLNILESAEVQNDDRDSDGKALTKEQIEFFKNSKVRDANGKLLVVYHGTPNRNVNEFSYDYVGSVGGANHGYGFYFTDSAREANLYAQGIGEVKKTYINITNPIYSESSDLRTKLDELFDRLPIYAKNALKAEYGDLNSAKRYFDEYIGKYGNGGFLSIFPNKASIHPAVFNSQVLRNMGYDGIIYREDGYSDEFVVFKSNQAKLTTNTNPTMSDDIRYSDRDDDISVYEKLGELDRVLKERDILKEDIQRLHERLKLEGKVTNGKYFTDSSILNLAGFLLKKADSKYDKVELARRLKSLYHGMTTNTKVDSDALWSEVLEIANDIALMAKPKIVKNDYAMNLLKEIKGTRVRFNSNQKAEAKARFGANWNRSFFGKIILADNANMELDEQWKVWAEEHPDIFDANVNDGNQVAELYDIINALKEQSEVIEEYNKEEFVQYIATEILGATWNLKPIVTTADKYTAKIKEIRSEHKQAMKDVRDAYNARVDEARLAERMFYGKKMSEMRKEYNAKLEKQRKTDSAKMADKLAEAKEQHEAEIYEKELAERMHFGAEIAKLRRQKDEKVAEAKELGKQKMADYRENIAKKTKIQSITSNVLDLNDKLVKNSKDKHIPEAMKDAVGELLRAIDFSSKRKLEGGEPTKKDIALEKALGHLKDAITDGSKEIGDILDEMYGSGIDDSIKELVKSVDKHMSSIDGQVFTLNEMTLDELNKLDSIVKIIKATANKVNKFHVAQHNAGVQALGVRSMEEIDSRKKIFKDDKKHFEKMKTSVFWNNLNPFYAFKNLGEASQKIFTALQDGQDKLAFLSKEVIDFADSVYSAKDYNKWKDTYFEFEVAQPNGKIAKFSMNVPQIMSLYCVTKQEDARTHILHGGEDGEGGGITIVETDKKEAVRTNIRLTEADLNNIISKLDGVNNVKGDKTAKDVADELQEFMCRRGADLGNEISMARWGIKSFGITNYFPIKVSEGSVPMKNDAPGVDSVSMLELLNMSFTHARNHFAKQSVEIGDVFDVFSSHMSNMARYNAMALPILDMYKWMNSRVRDEYGAEHSVQTSIKDTFGEYAWKYFGTLLKDISGGTKKSTRDKLAVRFFKNAKVAKVAANIRVVALQFTSYIRAGAVMDNKYLLKALNYFSTRDLKDEAYKNAITKAKKYCGIALWKSMGYYDTDITRGLTEQIKHSTNVRSKLVELSLKGAEWADETTWGMMWNACEFEIRDKHPELKPKTEEYYKAVGERLRDVIYRTQVVDSMLTRSQMMRSPDAWDKVLTMFGSESTLSLNLAMDVFTSYELDKRSLGKEKAKAKNKKYIRKAITAYIVTNVVTSALQTLFDAFRDYDEDEKDEEYLTKLMLENFLSNSSIINKIPYLNAFSSIISGFTPSRTDVDWMNDSVKAVKAIYKCFAEGKSVEPAIKYTLKTLSDASGIAGYNLYRDIYALYELFNGD